MNEPPPQKKKKKKKTWGYKGNANFEHAWQSHVCTGASHPVHALNVLGPIIGIRIAETSGLGFETRLKSATRNNRAARDQALRHFDAMASSIRLLRQRKQVSSAIPDPILIP